MWLVRSKPLDIYLGETLFGIRCPYLAETEWFEWSGWQTDVLVLLEKLALLRPDGATARLWLSGALARPFIVPADRDAQTPLEIQALADLLAPQASMLDGELQVWTEGRRPTPGMLAVATDARLRSELATRLAANEVKVVSMRPWWNLIFDRHESMPVWVDPAPVEESGNMLQRMRNWLPARGAAAGKGAVWSLAEPDSLTVIAQQGRAVRYAQTHEVLSHDPAWQNVLRRSHVVEGWDSQQSSAWVWQRNPPSQVQAGDSAQTDWPIAHAAVCQQAGKN